MKFIVLKLAVKNLFNRKSFSLISVIGLAIAFVTVFYIYPYVTFEMGYDIQHKKANRIYRVSGDIVAAENTMSHAVTGPLMGTALKDEFPAVESSVRLKPFKHSISLETEKGKFDIAEAYMADHSVFDVFTIEFIRGSENNALLNPNEVIINRTLCLKIFGEIPSIGKTIEIDHQLFKLVGIIKDSPENSHHKLNVLFSMDRQLVNPNLNGLQAQQVSEGYWMPSVYTFILLKPGSKIESITENFEPFYQKYMATFGTLINAKFKPIVIPLKKLHFSKRMSYDYPKGNKTNAYILSITAIFILLIAFFNYTGLLFSQNISQSKNVGIKKIIGASRGSFYFQYFFNSLVLIFSALILAWGIFLFSLVFFEQDLSLKLNNIVIMQILKLSVFLLILTTIISSLIPYLNQYAKRGIDMIKVQHANTFRMKGKLFGNIMTTGQYAMSIVLLVSVMVIARQLNFLIKSDMGFDKDNVLLLKISDGETGPQSIESFKNDLLESPFISNVSYSTNIPGDVMGSFHFQFLRNGEEVTKIINTMGVDYDYIPLMDIKLAEGRNFNESFNDNNFKSLIVNEAFLDFCGFSDKIIGSQVGESTVIGILKNVSFNSFHNMAEPMAFYLTNQNKGYLNIKLNTSEIENAIGFIQEKWQNRFEDAPFDLQFLDNRIEMMYKEDKRIGMLAKIFTLISILISTIGLFNLSTIIIKRKTKEVGVRKVNGAKIHEVIWMLNSGFVRSIFFAFIFACPVSFYFMHKWLENFAYRTNLSWWIFAMAGIIALGIALTTVSWQSWRAARRNPIEALRYE